MLHDVNGKILKLLYDLKCLIFLYFLLSKKIEKTKAMFGDCTQKFMKWIGKSRNSQKY